MSRLFLLYTIACARSEDLVFPVCMYLALASGGYDYEWGDVKRLHYTPSVFYSTF